LTSKPSSAFPVSILQSSVKLTKEPPSGLRSNIRSSMMNDIVTESLFYDGVCAGPAAVAWKKLLFSLCLFHATVQERRSFGSIGWNVPYGFSESDIRISLRQLRTVFALWNKPTLYNNETGEEEKEQVVTGGKEQKGPGRSAKKATEETKEEAAAQNQEEDVTSEAWVQQVKEVQSTIPWKALRYTIGACNYGGRVTDSKDRVRLKPLLLRLLLCLLLRGHRSC
jgi:dynein heavy chain